MQEENIHKSLTNMGLNESGSVGMMLCVPKPTRDKLIPTQITPAAYKALADFCDRRDRIKRDTISKIVLALLGQPESVRTVLLGEVDEGMGLAYAAALEQLASAERAKAKGRHYKTAQTEFVKPPANGTPEAAAPHGPPGPTPPAGPQGKGRR